MPRRRKRHRGEEESADAPTTTAPPELDTVAPALQQQSFLVTSKSHRRRATAVTPSFLFAPITVLPPWQRVALSTLCRLHESQANEHRAAAHGRTLQRDLTRYHEDLQRREDRLRAKQRETRARLGNKLFTAIEKQWARRGDVFQQLLCVEFDEVKRRQTERRQEDLLREAENTTRTLLDDIFSETKPPSLPSAHGDDDDANTAAVTAALQNSDMTGGMSGSVLESSLSLLDTQNGRRPLRDYQRSALRWMTNLYTKKLNGILADEMGLGKTIQTIALLAFFAEYKNDWGPHLIVVPTTVVLNWKAEFQRWCPGLKVLVYIGSRKERHRLRKGWMGEDAFHVCITSYNLMVTERAVFRRRPWGFLVLDEAHQVKNFMSKKWQSLFDLQAEYRLLLTGTPLQSSVMELWSLFHFLLPSASAFSSNEEFREWFSNPMEDMVTGRTSLNEEVVRRLQSLLRPFMLRRLKKDVESQLPSKTEKVVVCRLSRRQRLLYDDYMQLTETRERIRGGAGGVLGVLLALRKVCNHPDMFEERRTLSPLALDCLSEITLLVPRDILLRGNDFSGRYRFQKWRLCVEDVSLALERSDDMLFDDAWLDCMWLRLLLNDQPLECPLSRYSAANFRWPVDASVEKIVGSDRKDCFSDAVWSMMCQQVREQQACAHQRYATTATIQAQQYQRMETAVRVWYPRSIEIVSYQGLGTLPPRLHPDVAQRACAIFPIAQKVAVYVPRVAAVHPPRLHCRLPVAHYLAFRSHTRESLAPLLAISKSPSNYHTRRGVFDASSFLAELWPLHVRRCFTFPDKRLLIHDCGKLQFLQHALKQLRRDGHRMLIFTQFVQMLNILERFLSIVGIPYLRIDGSTPAEKRQAFVDRFNDDDRITCMILSTRSGGIGLNLTGADTVIFYDSDWNPTMDLQAQDRCHRIGQTKPVTIYRLISEHTVEENILQKARERKKLNNVVIRGGQFHAMASVDEVYEDSAAAFAALSDPVRLRSFFHDLDEDATVMEHQCPRGELHGKDSSMKEPVDIRAEMMRLEDQEDREAQQNVEEELRELEEQKRNDEAELGAEDEEGDDADADEEGTPGEGRKRKRRREETEEEREEGLMQLPMTDNNNDNNVALVDTHAGVPRGASPMVVHRRRDIMRRQRTPLDRLLSVRFATCHPAEARNRYDALCETYAAHVGENELPQFTTAFQL
ncbi:putative helicase [Trypanosoma rangeli]|uniref:Putative helicase n=1 Tax=Trypanosoma rangeli TaxID=5698 RepID=A0A3R7RLN6_TRYRA|nr:putative helicase [Trypanosoma rangeli]RNF06590.1 putative helicase [Trypanosoma rangeli]|eukprot:RNF06590.1 putative helicase [Trypanosoma rangeli]